MTEWGFSTSSGLSVEDGGFYSHFDKVGFSGGGGLSTREELRVIRRSLSQINGQIELLKKVDKDLAAKLEGFQVAASMSSQIAGTGLNMWYLGRLASRGTMGLAGGIGLAGLMGISSGMEGAIQANAELVALDQAIANHQIILSEEGYQRRKNDVWTRGLLHAVSIGIL